MPPTDAYPQHVVTAVIVAHDGAAWLPHLIEALDAQSKPVQRVVAVDTGSRDRSGSVLASHLGQAAVFGMDRSTGYAAAVRRAVAHKAANAPVSSQPGWGRGGDRAGETEWLWLLHDDCEPAADALEQLLRGATETPQAAVLGPKLRDWTDRDVIVEAGLTIDSAGRRVTGVEPHEVDQGQHDGDRDSLAVCSAGLLVRRDVWERLGGFDPSMALFSEDIDFCWRVHEAGFRVRVITDAVVYHARAATRGRRAISVGRRARLLDRRNGLITLLGNLPPGPMLASLLGNLALTLVRTLFYLVAKRPAAALDESAGALGIAAGPLRLARVRRLRSRGRRAAYGALRADLPPGRSVRRAAEFAARLLSRQAQDDEPPTQHATDDPMDDESLLTDTGFLQRLLTRPGFLLVLALIVIAAVAERRVITGGTLGGGSLLPAWEGASGLWAQFLQAYHPIGIGSASAGPPYVGAVALLATLLLGKAWLAVDVLLLGCVPLAGATAFLALRRVTRSAPVRIWAAASYALLPIAFGAISAGRLGSAVAFVLIPVVGKLAGRMLTGPAKFARRAAWATGLTITIGAAFVPLLWPLAVGGAALAALTLRRSARALLANLGIAVLTPLVLLLPWLVPLLAHPTALLLEAGVNQAGLATPDLPAKSLLLLSPGGPGLPPYWVSAALLVTGLAALLTTRRLRLVLGGWTVALLGFATALLASRVTVTPAGSPPLAAWPGVALAVSAAGLLLAAAAAADGLLSAGAAGAGARQGGAGRTAGRGRSGRASRGGGARQARARVPLVILGLVACTAPVAAAGYWLTRGVSGPVGPAAGEVVPSLVSSVSGSSRQLRTLVLASSGGQVSYLLLRGTSPEFSYPDVSQVPAAQAALDRAVAGLVAPGGAEAADQSRQLAGFDIGFVLMRAPLDDNLASVLDNVPGLTPVSMTPAFDLWRLTTLPSLVSVIEPSGAVVAVPSSPVGVGGAKVPAAGGTVLLSEPAGGWSAAVNGHGLSPVRSPAGGWAQAFRLPAGGGTLTISRNGLWHDLLMAVEVLAFLVVAGLALPGIRTAAEIEAAAAAEAAAEVDVAGGATEPEAGPPSGVPARRGPVSIPSRRARSARRQAGLLSRLGRASRVTAAAGAGAAAATGVDEPRLPGRRPTGIGLPSRVAGQTPDRAAADSAGTAGRTAFEATEVFAAGTDGGRSASSAGRRLPIGGRLAARAGSGQSSGQGTRPGREGWPAEQPTNPFTDPPPASYPTGRRRRMPADPRGAGTALSPSGMPFEETDIQGSPARHRGRYRDRPAEALSPSGSRFPDDAPHHAGPDYDAPAHGGPEHRAPAYGGPDHRAPAYGGRDYADANYADADYARPATGYPGGGGHRDDSTYPRSAAPYQPEDEFQGQPGTGGSWDDRSQPSAWPSGYQQGWPQEYPPGAPPGQRRRGSDRDELAGLPPAGEVHHDWPGRRDRAARSWPAPEEDGEDTW